MKDMKIVALVAAPLTILFAQAAQPLRAAVTPINDIMIDVRDPCMAPPMAVNLGDLSIDLTYDAANDEANMTATFTVDENVDGTDSKIWDWIEVHFLQTIWLDNDPNRPTIGGVKPNLPVVDPPKGGWDYMYNDGAARTMPNLNIPNYGWFIDDDPWYYNETGEDAEFTETEEYSINDVPSIGNGVQVGFSTYLAVEPERVICTHEFCLQEGEILILAGFDWLVDGTAETATVTDTFYAPSPFDVADITRALANGNFTGWTVVDNKDICCPEPGACLLALAAIGFGLPLRRGRAA
jgi:hypothetical protein